MDVKWRIPASAVFPGEKQRIDLWLALHLYGNCSSGVLQDAGRLDAPEGQQIISTP